MAAPALISGYNPVGSHLPAHGNMTRNSSPRADRPSSPAESTREQQYGAILAALPEGVLVHDSAGRIVFCNPSAERILGLPAGQLIGKALQEPAESTLCADGTPMASGQHPVAITLQTGAPCRDVILGWTRPGGTLIWLAINSEPVGRAEEPAAREVIVTLRDVTRQRRIESALQESEERLRLATEANHLGTWEVYPQTGKRVWSPLVRKLFGFPPDAVISNEDFLNAVHPDDRERVAAEIRALMSPDHGVKSFSEFRTLHTPEGREQWVASWGRTLFDDGGTPVRMIGVTQDVTGRKKAEQEHQKLQEQLQQAQQMESIGRLAGGLAHDFNNLLTVINGYANVALKELGPQHALAEPIDEIRKAGEAAAELIRQLLAFSRKQILRQEAVDVNAMLREMAQHLAAVAGATVEVRTALAPSLKAVSADRGQIEQVIHNLAAHARDAMPQGGILTIETKDVTRGPVCGHCLEGLRPGEYVCISVRDTGAGMDEATRQHLFEPFFGGGTSGMRSGLSLATVHGIVVQSGGHIDVESHPGAGTSFEINLPAVEEISNSTQVAAAHRAESAPPGRATILLVEDQPEVRRFTAGLLQQHGYEVAEAASAEEALSQFAGQPIDLVLTDVRLPGMNGCELAAALRSRNPGARVLFMSGYAEEMLTGQTRAIRGAAVIQKPFRPAALADKVREVLSAAPLN
jgi:two-component system cell cycle sensor histidine kinase/response regulator CckA